ncbi:Nucleolar GTP-binding protein 1 [Spraguea lophii 42_110]|uniref:Nucleolar GTP-binding protein 1 n=1 Tax=Spraguea lophii (strain 42_110) TaxID=1358809 RepID=S7XJD0_SPRLO|nr:Nucleolar GTP-binding protein 1 [Spraguea lophii 42_110]
MSLDFRNIKPVPLNTHLIDIILSKTQRGRPTVIRKHYDIKRIRTFYMEKVKFGGNQFIERFQDIIDKFPVMEDIHPFYCDLINVLYDKDHYKMALGHINISKRIIEDIVKEYLKLLKYGDSLYRCKQLKRAALGRMVTTTKKLKSTLEYLEEVRQHMSRLPEIDPQTRTLLICGYPNVGKSSFMNKITRANVDVQSFAFTTKNLFVGHFDYKYLNWQVIDTPGVLDHPLKDMNTIEMQSITALAHIDSCVLFFFDVSEGCGYSFEEQINLFQSLEPLLNKKMIIILSKCDIISLDNLDDERKNKVNEFLANRKYVEISSKTDLNIEVAKEMACEVILEENIKKKCEGKEIEKVMNQVRVINPDILNERAECMLRAEPIITEKVKENEQADYLFDAREKYYVKEEWKKDVVPEFYNGKNIVDFLDTEIEKNVQEYKKEVENLELRDFDLLDKDTREHIKRVTGRKSVKIQESRLSKRTRVNKRLLMRKQKNRVITPEEKPIKEKKENIKNNNVYPKQDKYREKPMHLYRKK